MKKTPAKPKAPARPKRKTGSTDWSIASWNVNGLRSVAKKGFLDWLKNHDFDVVMLQEIKANPEIFAELEDLRRPHSLAHAILACGEKPGYSGLLTYARHEPDDVRCGLGEKKFDQEGRWLEVDFGKVTYINSYFPNSQRDHARLPYKLEFCAMAQDRLQSLKGKRTVILAGDINVAHTEIDLANPKTNKENAGFLPEERAWFTSFLEAGWKDAFRMFEPGGGHYTWWSYRPGVRERNVGWRLDHFFVDEKSAGRVVSAKHQPHIKGSDHCPIILTLSK